MSKANDRLAMVRAMKIRLPYWRISHETIDDGSLDPWSPHVRAQFAGAEIVFVSRDEFWAEYTGLENLPWALSGDIDTSGRAWANIVLDVCLNWLRHAELSRHTMDARQDEGVDDG